MKVTIHAFICAEHSEEFDRETSRYEERTRFKAWPCDVSGEDKVLVCEHDFEIEVEYDDMGAYVWDRVSEANLTLASAAHDMLTALETVLAGGHLNTGEQAIVANAIAKATGRNVVSVVEGK